MKARFMMRCECCGSHIATGSRFVMFHGRPWITTHVIEYKKKRSSIAAAALTQ